MPRRPAGDFSERIQSFLELPADTPQEEIQSRLEEIHRDCDLPTVMDCLFRWELNAGYITREKLEEVERLTFPDPDTGVEFRIQVNYARTKYTASQQASLPPADASAPKPCLLCRDNIGRPGKEFLRIYEFPLSSNNGRERRFFLQLSPFPLYPYHFVPVLSEHTPQLINARSVEDMFDFLRQAPGYTVCSNSDVEWAGASILNHLHYQVFRGLLLPVIDAWHVPMLSRRLPGATVEYLHYPLAALRIIGAEEEPVRAAASALIELWKGKDPGRNTANLVLIRTAGVQAGAPSGYHFTVLLRNPDYRTPEPLRRLKSEGVGVIEASGEGILPVPQGPDAQEMWREIRENGLALVKSLISGNSPPRDPERMAALLEELARRLG